MAAVSASAFSFPPVYVSRRIRIFTIPKQSGSFSETHRVYDIGRKGTVAGRRTRSGPDVTTRCTGGSGGCKTARLIQKKTGYYKESTVQPEHRGDGSRSAVITETGRAERKRTEKGRKEEKSYEKCNEQGTEQGTGSGHELCTEGSGAQSSKAGGHRRKTGLERKI